MSQFLADLTSAQIDEILRLIGIFLTLMGTVVSFLLLYFQRQNRKDLSKQIEDNTTVSTEGFKKAEQALTVANNHKENLSKALQTVGEVAKKLDDSTPRPVIIVNPPETPVITKSALHSDEEESPNSAESQ